MKVTIQDLYKAIKVIKVQFVGKTHAYHINLSKPELDVKMSNFKDTIDCRITSWTDDVWFRTPKGENYEKYKSIGNLKQAITLSAKSRGFEVEKFIIQAPKL